jgi:hypothetical protein
MHFRSWAPTFQNFSEGSGLRYNSPGRQSQRIQNAADDKETAQEGAEWNQCVHSPLLLLKSRNDLSENKTDHTQLNRLHYPTKVRRPEALWKTINIQQTISLCQRFPNFYTLRPPPSRFCFNLPPPPGKKHIKYYIWNINNLILLKRPSSNT